MNNSSVKIKCPICNSEDVYREKYSREVFAISYLILGIPIPFKSRKCYCFNCQSEFKKSRNSE